MLRVCLLKSRASSSSLIIPCASERPGILKNLRLNIQDRDVQDNCALIFVVWGGVVSDEGGLV